MSGEKAIYYPTTEAAVLPYYNNAVTQLAAGLAAKYNISPAVMTILQNHNTSLQQTYEEAIEKNNIAEASTRAKDEEFALAKLDLLRELFRLQRLPHRETLPARARSPPA